MNERQMMADEARTLKRFQTEMREEFKKYRDRAGIVEYTDTRALGWVRDVVEQLYRKEEMRDIIAAVRSIAAKPHASPWAIRDECFRISAQRQREENVTRRAAEHEVGANLPVMPKMGMRR